MARRRVGSRGRPQFRFQVKEREKSTGLYAFGKRHYEPRFGVWLSADPALPEYFTSNLAGGMHNPRNLGLYAYTWNKPLRFVDPDGQWVQVVVRGVQLAARYGPRVAAALSAAWKVAKPQIKRVAKRVSSEVALGYTSREVRGQSHTGKAFLDDVVAGVAGAFGGKKKNSEGIYEFVGRTGKKYLGRSRHMLKRLRQHRRSGKLPEGNDVKMIEVAGGKTARELAEQRRIDALSGRNKVENKVNPIGLKRKHLLDPGQ